MGLIFEGQMHQGHPIHNIRFPRTRRASLSSFLSHFQTALSAFHQCCNQHHLIRTFRPLATQCLQPGSLLSVVCAAVSSLKGTSRRTERLLLPEVESPFPHSKQEHSRKGGWGRVFLSLSEFWHPHPAGICVGYFIVHCSLGLMSFY